MFGLMDYKDLEVFIGCDINYVGECSRNGIFIGRISDVDIIDDNGTTIYNVKYQPNIPVDEIYFKGIIIK